MEHIYIAMVDTPGIFAAVIRRFLGQRYIHVVIGLDAELEEAYSFGRRNPRVPWFAGFEREDKEKILRAFPTAAYKVCELECTKAQKAGIQRRLRQDYKKRYHYHYAVPGLPFIALGRPFYLKDQYTCSSYIARLLAEYQIRICGKHFSLVTPKDFCQYAYNRVIYEGSLAGFVGAVPEKAEVAAAASVQLAQTVVTTEEIGRYRLPGTQGGSKRSDKDRERTQPGSYGMGVSERVVAYGS